MTQVEPQRVVPNVISAVFENRDAAGEAIQALRDLGVGDAAFSVVSRQPEEETPEVTPAAPELRPGLAAVDGAGVGAAVGALFGLASAVIPGAGPFITAGALAQALGAVAGSAASGAIVGGTSGALAGVIAHLGVTEAESRFYAGEVERGGVYLGVDLAQTVLDRGTVQGILERHGGRQGGSG
jgi:hypothetical protein